METGKRCDTVVGWSNMWSGDVWCRGEHTDSDDVKATMGPRQAAVVDLTEITLGEAKALDVSLICNTCGRPVHAWLESDS